MILTVDLYFFFISFLAWFVFFFFQAEDGIRDADVTGVQTCALPIYHPWLAAKLLALLLYIGLGTVAIKRGRSPAVRGAAALAAVMTFAYMLGAALNHSPLSWLAAA